MSSNRFGNSKKGYNPPFTGGTVVTEGSSFIHAAETERRGSSPLGARDILGCKRSPSICRQTCYGVWEVL